MSRTIKFRIWDSINKKMIPSSDSPWLEAKIGDKFVPLLTVSFVEGGKKGLIPQQFTGLSDKNNREIYEGDIVNYPDIARYLVYWNNDRWDLECIEKHGLEGYMFGIADDEFPNSFIEIIGNIFENPLMGKGVKFEFNPLLHEQSR